MTASALLFAIDRGRATTAVSLLAIVGGRWRLLGAKAMPATVDGEAIVERLLAEVGGSDPLLARELGIGARTSRDVERVEVTSHVPGTMAVVTATERMQAALRPIVATSGWHVAPATIETHDPRAMTALLLASRVTAVLAGADTRAGADERGGLADLGALLGGVAARRPDLPILLVGAMAGQEHRIREWVGDEAVLVLAPDPGAGNPAGSPLRSVLVALGRGPGDSRAGIQRATEMLADALDRRIELLEVGASAGLRVIAEPPTAGLATRVCAAEVAAAALVPSELDDETLDGIARWSTMTLDRHRLHDRLAELESDPWADAPGDGARLRMAAGRAALERLIGATADLSAGPSPDLVVLAGGPWSVAPGPAVSLAVADVLRHSAATQLAFDHAHLLGPLGALVGDDRARTIVTDLAGDLLLPLGASVIPAGVRPGRLGGHATVRIADPEAPEGVAVTTLELTSGGIAFVDLPPGLVGTIELDFREPVILGGRSRRFTLDVAGGLGGLLIDLRDIPLRLPERHDLRRDLLGSWQDGLWPGDER